jgi:preprotein translocase subunit YajC
VKNFLPFLIILILFGGLLLLNRRNRERAARQDSERRTKLRPGTEVMTTSGLYATVVALNPDGQTAVVQVAPGVEVKWSTSALREVSDLPQRYRPGAQPEPGSETQSGPDSGLSGGDQPGSSGTGYPNSYWDQPPDPQNPDAR